MTPKLSWINLLERNLIKQKLSTHMSRTLSQKYPIRAHKDLRWPYDYVETYIFWKTRNQNDLKTRSTFIHLGLRELIIESWLLVKVEAAYCVVGGIFCENYLHYHPGFCQLVPETNWPRNIFSYLNYKYSGPTGPWTLSMSNIMVDGLARRQNGGYLK